MSDLERHRRKVEGDAMKYVPFLLFALAVCLAFPGGAGASAGATRSYIVVYNNSVANVNRETDALEQADDFSSHFRYRSAIKGFAADLTDKQVAELRGDPAVASISLDREVHALGTQPLAPGETVPTGVARIGAVASGTARPASSARVAVIDTGIELTHPDLNAVSAKNCVSPTASANDDNGHGTHVAGTIAAKNNGSRVVGVAPGTQLYAVKVLNSAGSGTWSQVICGIDWVTQNAGALNIKVANMSLGGGGSSSDGNSCASGATSALHLAICNSTKAGVAYSVAAGNSGWDFDYAPAPDVPAAYPEVLTVTAMSDSDGKPGGTGGAPSCRAGELDDSYASFSNFAATAAGQKHTLAGPGVCILSDWLGGGLNTISGTSMATPHVTGTVALCDGEAGSTTAGPCAGVTDPALLIPKITRTDSAYGFVGDPTRPVSWGFYGYLVWAGTTTTAPPPPPSPTPQAPTVTTGAASNVSHTSATVSGSVNPNAQTTSWWFDYGTTTTYGSKTASQTLAASSTASTVSATLGGLTASTTYHYRPCATNATGTTCGSDATFQTTAPPPPPPPPPPLPDEGDN
jgi:subtilisin family serine protease